MDNEIKEILDRLKGYDNYKYRNENGRSYKELEGWEIDLLLNSYTNLQEENKNLKLSLKDRLKYSDELDEKQEIIDKAFEYIQKQKSKMYKSRNKIAMYILMKLEKILQGDENND